MYFNGRLAFAQMMRLSLGRQREVFTGATEEIRVCTQQQLNDWERFKCFTG